MDGTDEDIRSRVVLTDEQRRALVERIRSDPETQKKHEQMLKKYPEFRRPRQKKEGE